MFITLLATVIVLGVLVFVHELGHFMVAKWSGIKVLSFSLGLGPKMFGIKRGDTDYIISWIPFGGYVKMAGDNPEELENKPDEFLSKPIPIRMLVVFAGPFMNFILAFIIMWLLIYIGGVGTVSTIKIGVPDKNTPAYKSELQKGDKILTINAEKVNSWDDILEKLYPNNKMHSNNIELQIQRIDSTGKRIITVELQNDNNYSHWGLNPLFTNEVGMVQKDSPAWKTGLKKDDKIIEVDNKPINDWEDLSAIINKSPEDTLQIKWIHKGKIKEGTVIPAKKIIPIDLENSEEMGIIGIASKMEKKKINLGKSLLMGWQQTLNAAMLLFYFLGVMVKQLFTGHLSQNMVGGPISIGQLAGDSFRWGAASLFNFMALLSVNLAVLNLLPIPVVDGGHLLIFTIEGIRKKPLSIKQQIRWQQVGMAFLLLLMLTVTVSDIIKVIK